VRGQADVVRLAVVVLAKLTGGDAVRGEQLDQLAELTGAAEVAQQDRGQGGKGGVHGVKVGAAERWLELLWVG